MSKVTIKCLFSNLKVCFLGELAHLTSLTELDLDDCGCIIDAGVERLAALVNLERLYLCRCPALSADAPLRLALCLPSTEVRHRIWPFIYPTPKLGFEYSRFMRLASHLMHSL